MLRFCSQVPALRGATLQSLHTQKSLIHVCILMPRSDESLEVIGGTWVPGTRGRIIRGCHSSWPQRTTVPCPSFFEGIGWTYPQPEKEMTRLNINILEISELKQMELGEFNSDDHCIYHCGQESLRRNGVAIIVNKSPKYSTCMRAQKQQTDLCSFPRQTIQYHSNSNLCPNQEC